MTVDTAIFNKLNLAQKNPPLITEYSYYEKELRLSLIFLEMHSKY